MRKIKGNKADNLCPCDLGGSYVRCCGRWHSGALAPDAQTLMRSRYSAYVLALNDYLAQTWHVLTRPSILAGDESVKWLGLTLKQAWPSKTFPDSEAFVAFTARYRVGGGPVKHIQETSRFVRENGRWFYMDGVFSE